MPSLYAVLIDCFKYFLSQCYCLFSTPSPHNTSPSSSKSFFPLLILLIFSVSSPHDFHISLSTCFLFSSSASLGSWLIFHLFHVLYSHYRFFFISSPANVPIPCSICCICPLLHVSFIFLLYYQLFLPLPVHSPLLCVYTLPFPRSYLFFRLTSLPHPAALTCSPLRFLSFPSSWPSDDYISPCI